MASNAPSLGNPKDRFGASRDGETRHNYLCKGLYHFFTHARRRGAYAPCPCGSGRKFRCCHGGQGPQPMPAE